MAPIHKMAPSLGIFLAGNRCGALSTTRVSAKYWWSAPVGALLGLRMDSSCQDPTTWSLALLKEFAATHGLKRSGKKAEVLERWADFRNLIAEDVCRHRNEPIPAWSNFFYAFTGCKSFLVREMNAPCQQSRCFVWHWLAYSKFTMVSKKKKKGNLLT